MARALLLPILFAAAAHADATLPVAAAAAGDRPPAGLQSTRRARIIRRGELYSTINETDCVSRWPSDEVKRQAGEKYWAQSGFYPHGGDVGTVVGEARHCDTRTRLVILKIGDHFVVMGASGVEELGPRVAAPRRR
jgi:hypothetical protein